MGFKIKRGFDWESINNDFAYAILTENFGFASPSIMLLLEGEIIATNQGQIRYEQNKNIPLFLSKDPGRH